jgi:hypothetical protein
MRVAIELAGRLVSALSALRERPATVTLSIAGAMIALLKASDVAAQAGCKYTAAVYCGGQIYCTTSAGSSCITCPK